MTAFSTSPELCVHALHGLGNGQNARLRREIASRRVRGHRLIVCRPSRTLAIACEPTVLTGAGLDVTLIPS